LLEAAAPLPYRHLRPASAAPAASKD